MLRIALVLFSYVLIYGAERLEIAEYYYLASSYCYALFAYVGIKIAIHQQSKLLWAYSLGNILAAIFNVMMVSPAYYSYFEWFYWDAFINYCLILNALDLMLVSTGMISVYVFIVSLLSSNICNILFNFRVMERSK